MILVAVGTSDNGFDELVEAADRAAAALGAPGLAQIGHGRFLPQALHWERFLPDSVFRRRLAEAHIVVCHGGMGILGEAMRARRPIVAMPRRGITSAANPTNDQLVDERYIVVGWGRDYADVPPLRGIIYTDSESSVIEVSVDVAPLEDDA